MKMKLMSVMTPEDLVDEGQIVDFMFYCKVGRDGGLMMFFLMSSSSKFHPLYMHFHLDRRRASAPGRGSIMEKRISIFGTVGGRASGLSC